MENKEFWSLIEASKEYESQTEWLTETLAKKEINEIVDFELILQKLLNESYQSRLWGAAYVIMGGCSDDCFDYFRGWLISQGEMCISQSDGRARIFGRVYCGTKPQ
ncbi:DUF4240 domain-containing protein [Bacillus sp. T33-2]|uniref:DUF4240 domain-containing protein n=1 Tax=Bacillus sp. T33-2 TaxID=2054168 RepID=UPI0021553653|nr:DUF4240 domain-containing protein [Bacillus sp. T33-2]